MVAQAYVMCNHRFYPCKNLADSKFVRTFARDFQSLLGSLQVPRWGFLHNCLCMSLGFSTLQTNDFDGLSVVSTSQNVVTLRYYLFKNRRC